MSTRFRTLGGVALLVALLLVLTMPQIAAAANTIVTPANPDGWQPTDVRADGTVAITADMPRDGLGSLKFTTNTVTAGQDKADFTKTWTSATRTLGSLTDLSFEFYRDSSSTTAAHFAPVLRLLWLQDNAPTGVGAEDNYGYLVWEQIYNGINPVPTNAWQSHNLFSTGNFWMRLVGGPNNVGGCEKTIQNYGVTLNQWLTANPQGQPGDCVAPDIDANTLIYGVNTGVGSGWGATFLGYVDNVVVAFGADTVSANYEPNPVCTTVCYADTVGGNDANGGSSAADAKKTIQAAVTQVTAGGQVYVAAGTYAEDVNVNKAVTVTGADPATTIIDPANYVSISADNVTFEDIAISNSGAHGVRLSKSGSPLANTTFDNVHFMNNVSRGIDIVNLLHVTNLQVLNSLFEGNAIGIRMPSNATADGIIIDNTTFQNQTGSGFNQANDGSTGWVKNLTVTDSTFINLGTSSGYAGVYAEEFSNVLIENSTFTGNRYGINLFDFYSVASSVTTNVTIRGNTFTDHKASTIAFRTTTSDPSAQLLLVEDNTFNQNVSNSVAGSFAVVAVSTHGTNANGAVDVVGNTITFSGALPAGATTAHGIYVQGGMEDVRIEGNDVNGGGIANNGGTIPPSGVYIQSFSMKANAVVLVTKNELTNLNNGVSVHSGSAFGGVKSPDFDVTRNDLSGNSAYGIQSGPTMVSDGTCNWWGDASGPSGQGLGSGTAVTTHVDFSTWLGTNDLNGACQAGATIKVSKVTDPNTDTTTVFTFDPSWSATNFTLKNGESLTSGLLPAGSYSVAEVSMPALWALQSATCDNTATVPVETDDPSSLTVAAGDTWECTFTNKQLELCTTVCYADAVNGNDADDGVTPATAFKTIQKAIDTVTPGGQVRVLPGNYDETAINRDVLGVGSYQFGLFFEETAKDGVSLLGVTAADVVITNPNATAAFITTNATNNFGNSGIFVEADDVTIAGVEIGPNTPGENKTIEVIGDNFTLKDSMMTGDGIDGAYPYINDWRYNDTTDTAYVERYTITNNIFGSGSQIAISSGAGGSGPASGRQITDNEFTMGAGQNWPSISFNGKGGVAWFTYPVGGAVITGNTFNNVAYGAEQWIRARGEYIEAQFDWASYWNDNTYDNATIAGAAVPASPRPYAYSTFTNVRRIGAKIQLEIDTVAQAGDTVLVNEGTYTESPKVNKSLTLRSDDGRDVTFIELQTGTNYTHSLLISGADVTVEGFTIVGIDAVCPTLAATNIYVDVSSDDVVIQDNRIQVGVSDDACSTGDDGFGLITVYSVQPDVATLTVEDNIFEPLTAAGGQRAFYINPSVVSFVFRDNDITGRFNGTAIAQAQNNLIEDNTVTGNGSSAGIGVWGEPDPTVWGHATIQRNTITGTVNAITIYEAQNVTVTKNILNANGRGVRVMTVVPLTFDKSTIHINRNAITNNTTEGISNLLAEAGDIDGTCNWWNSASGPGAVASGSGDKVSAKVDYTPWLYTNDLDGPCFTGGTISIDKVAPGAGATLFTFDVSWSANHVTLTDAGAPYVTNPPLQAGNYNIAEINLPTGWSLQSAMCDNTTTTPVETVNPSSIPVVDGDAWVCTFTNTYTAPPSNTCPVGAASNQWTDLLGIGMGSPKKHKVSVKLVIPNATNLVDLYGQLVAKNTGAAKYVRFILPGKNNFVEVNTVTAPADHQAGNFWYGSDLPTAGTTYVTGKWFLQKSGTKTHIPRAFVLYPTYNDPAHTYVNVWDTYTPAEGEVDWNTANGWTPYRRIVVPIAAPLGPETFHVELALADNDKDARPVWVTVTAGGVTQTVKPTNPDKGDQLNLLVFDLANVPAGTAEIVIEVYSPSQAIDGILGDSASLVGMTANYQCSPLSD